MQPRPKRSDPLKFDALRRVSAAIGADLALVQGPGGNTSLKQDDVLWVKASGLWLDRALHEAVFTAVSLSQVRAQLAAGADAFGEAVLADLAPAGLKPSVETALHALMPHPVVIHAHAVEAMTVSVLADGEARAAAALAGLGWAWIPYRRPGLPLAEAVAAALTPGIDVLILQNHGVVVGGETPDAAQALLLEVERRLALTVRAPNLDLAKLEALQTARYEIHPMASPAALDPVALLAAAGAPLFPDQVTFLGAVAVIGEAADIDAQTAPLLLIPGHGALARRDRSRNAESQVLGLAQVLLRLPQGVPVQGLGDHDCAALLGWEGEHWRQGLDRPLAAGV